MHIRTPGDKLVDLFLYIMLGLFALVCVLPFISTVVSSFTSSEELMQRGFVFVPRSPTLDAYRYIFAAQTIPRSLMVTVYITIMGTAVSMIMTVTMAYALAHEELRGRKIIMFMVIFSMQFSGGMIPTFILVRALGMLDSFSALIIPSAIAAFNLIIMKNAFQQIPKELGESARIDGATDLRIMWSIMLPVSTATLATLTLFYAVSNWNTMFSAILYIQRAENWPIQVLLRSIVILATGAAGDGTDLDPDVVIPSQTIKNAVIVIATMPILMVYPFLQKHFTKGVLVGSIKG